jgi:hypothetical protein
MNAGRGDGTSSPPPKRGEVSFSIQTIDCIACSPALGRGLRTIRGVLEVKDLPMLNRMIVVYDPLLMDRPTVLREIAHVAEKSGLGGKILFGPPLHS